MNGFGPGFSCHTLGGLGIGPHRVEDVDDVVDLVLGEGMWAKWGQRTPKRPAELVGAEGFEPPTAGV